MADLTPEQILADAKAKYHLLVTGQAARVVLDGNTGDRIEFQGATADKLLEYIRTMDPTYLLPVDISQRVSRPFRYFF